MSRRWRHGLVLALIAGLAGLSLYQYQRLQAALPLPLQADPRAAEYRVLQRLAAELARPMRLRAGARDEVLDFRARQETLAAFKAYALSSPFRSELLLMADTPAWTEAWLGGPQPRRIHEGLSGDPTWILPVNNGLRWSLHVRSLEAPEAAASTAELNRRLLGLVLCTALCAVAAGVAAGAAIGRRFALLERPAGPCSDSEPAWNGLRTDLGALDEVMSDHLRLRHELSRQSEELAAITEAVRQRREQRRREGQPA